MVELDLVDPLLGKNDLCVGGKVAEVDESLVENGFPFSDAKEASVQESTVDSCGKTSFWQTTMNLVNILIGMGLIALPVTFEEGGWLSLVVLLGFACICCYTGVLLGRMASHSGIKSYPAIVEATFGTWGRRITMTIIFLDIGAFLVGNTIALGDNLARIFPNARLNLSWLDVTLEPSQALVIIAVLVALPSTWLRDMSSLSFISVGGVVTSLVVIVALAWAGLFGGVGFHYSPPLLNLRNLPIVSGIYAYCYSGHILIPNIYSGMANPAQFPRVSMAAFSVATVIYGTTAILGVTMFGEDTQSQITLNIPKHLFVATIALWTTVLTPLCKYGLAVAPAAEQIEGFLPLPKDSKTFVTISTLIRTLILFSVTVIAIAMPFFHNILALCGASIALTMTVTLPVICNLKIFRGSLSYAEIGCSLVCIVVGIFFTIVGTETSFRALMESLSN
ncbi:unnamed protein product [Calypogeia fissa]